MKVTGIETLDIEGDYPDEYNQAKAYLDELGFAIVDEVTYAPGGTTSHPELEFKIIAEREVSHDIISTPPTPAQ